MTYKKEWKDFSNTILIEGGCQKIMKQHRFWAWVMIIAAFMTIYTGYKHK